MGASDVVVAVPGSRIPGSDVGMERFEVDADPFHGEAHRRPICLQATRGVGAAIAQHRPHHRKGDGETVGGLRGVVVGPEDLDELFPVYGPPPAGQQHLEEVARLLRLPRLGPDGITVDHDPEPTECLDPHRARVGPTGQGVGLGEEPTGAEGPERVGDGAEHVPPGGTELDHPEAGAGPPEGVAEVRPRANRFGERSGLGAAGDASQFDGLGHPGPVPAGACDGEGPFGRPRCLGGLATRQVDFGEGEEGVDMTEDRPGPHRRRRQLEGGVGVFVHQHPGKPGDGGNEALLVPDGLEDRSRLLVGRPRTHQVPPQPIHVPHRLERIGDLARAEAPPDDAGDLEVRQRLVDTPQPEVCLATVGGGEGAQGDVATEVGEVERHAALVDRCLEGTLFEQPRSAVHVDANLLEDVPGRDCMVEGPLVERLVGPPVPLQRRHHGLGRVGSGEGGVRAGLERRLEGGACQPPAGLGIASDPSGGGPPAEQHRPVGEGPLATPLEHADGQFQLAPKVVDEPDPPRHARVDWPLLGHCPAVGGQRPVPVADGLECVTEQPLEGGIARRHVADDVDEVCGAAAGDEGPPEIGGDPTDQWEVTGGGGMGEGFEGLPPFRVPT